ncbi:hypothetical protein ACVWZ7_000537 [Arthrobacter sp. TE12232]
MQFESHLGHSVSAGQKLFGFLVLTKLDIFRLRCRASLRSATLCVPVGLLYGAREAIDKFLNLRNDHGMTRELGDGGSPLESGS